MPTLPVEPVYPFEMDQAPQVADDGYDYDVAFSFLAKDEGLAAEICDAIGGSLRTFLYSKRQGEIAGTDGERTFGEIFGRKARLVVVLYRKEWGSTPWTRIEATAIRNRGFDYGYDFVLLIPVDSPPEVPPWLPRNRLWLDLGRLGVKGAAAVIETRARDRGATPTVETVSERAARLQRAITFADQKKRMLASDRGVQLARAEFGGLLAEVERLVAEIQKAGTFALTIRKERGPFFVEANARWLQIVFKNPYVNTLANSELELSIWGGHPPAPGIWYVSGEAPPRISARNYEFDLLPPENGLWRATNGKGEMLGSVALASSALQWLMESEHTARTKR